MELSLQMLQGKSRKLKAVYVPLIVALFLPGAQATEAKEKRLTEYGKEAARFVNVTGTVRDSKGEPLPGVTVTIKGTKTSTATDGNGVFRLNLPIGNETLVFNFLGFKSKEVQAGGSSNLTVVLEESTSTLNEVVVVGYGTQKKAHLTGSVVDIKAEEIENIPATNVGAALAGRLIGVGVSGGNSRPGSKASIAIRNPVGVFSKDGGSNAPLYVIDGVAQASPNGSPDPTQFNNLDPSEIESISFLKDAAAAIYGVRGANGVVLVTTKRGQVGKPRVSYSGSYAINDEAYRTKMMDAYQFGLYTNILNGPNGNNKNEINTTDYNNYLFSQDELDYFKTINFDRLEDAWKASYLMRHALNVSGGTETANYFAGITYSKQDGNLNTLDYNKWNFRAGTDVRPAKNLKVGLQVSAYNDDLTKTFNKVSGEGQEDDYKNLLLAPRYVPEYVDGYAVWLPGRTNDLSRYHYGEIQRLGNIAENRSNFMTVNLNAEYEIPWVKGLKARASYSRNTQISRGSQIGTKYDIYSFSGMKGENGHIYEGATGPVALSVSNGNRLYYSNINARNIQSNLFISYDRQFGKHNLSGLFGVERGEANNNQEDVWRDSPIASTNGQFGTAFGAIDGKTAGNESGSLGYIGRLNYRYEDKYLAEFLFRTDASTRFAPENYWGKFYSGSFGWVVSQEDFFNVNWIDFLKVRYSTGLLGSDQTGAWQWRQRYTFQGGKGGVFGGNNNATIGMKMEKSPNRNATWSSEYKNNLGLDLRFLNDRLSSTIDAYYNHGYDILIERIGSVPPTVGGSVASQNYGKVDYFGYEFSLGWNDKVGDFTYGINTRLSWSDDRVYRMNYNETDMLYPWRASYNRSSDLGQWGYDYLGMFRTQDEINAYVAEYGITQMLNVNAADLKPGMLYYRDVRGPLQADGTFAAPDGIVDSNDQIQLNDRASAHYGYGVTLKAGYKNFSLDVVIAGSFGGWNEITERDALNSDIRRNYTSLPVIWGNVYDPVLNPSGTMPNPAWQDTYNVSSNFWKTSNFTMRITSFNLNYSLPKSITSALKINRANVFFSGLNPVYLANPFSYKDPTASWNAYPNLKTYSFGINLSL